jgi:hypothetical protein
MGAIPARAAGFLVITFYVFGQIHVHHVAHVRFIDTHPKGDCSHDNFYIIPQKGFLVFGFFFVG